MEDRTRLLPCHVAVWLLAALLGVGPTSRAATITVDGTADDTLSVLDGNGTCDLREAISAANTDLPAGECPAGSGADTVDFALEPYPRIIRIREVNLVVSQPVTISGPGSGNLLLLNVGGLSNLGSGRLFLVDDQSPVDIPVAINGVSLSSELNFGVILNRESLLVSGVTCSDSLSAQGGCLRNNINGDLTVSDSTFEGNDAGTSGGGAISNAGSAVIENVEFRDNSAVSGGAIFNSGSLSVIDGLFVNNRGAVSTTSALTITDSRFEDNSSSGGRFSVIECDGPIVCDIRTTDIVANAGQLFSIEGGATIQLLQSLIADNNPGTTTLPDLISVPSQSTLLVENSTIANNNLVTNTISLEEDSATLTLRGSTVASNGASPNTAILANLDSIVVIEGSIVSGHDSDLSTNENPPFFVPSITIDDSILGVVSGTFSGDNNLLGIDPELGLLQDNGGPTFTMAISETSPAVDLVPVGQSGCGSSIVADQRGEPRPMGPGCDAGAFEQRDIDLIFGDGFE